MRYARYYFSNYGWIPVDFGAGEEEGGRFESSRERRAIPPWIHSHPHEIQSSQLQRRGGRADEQRRGLCTTRSKPIHITFLDVRCFIYNLFISSSVQPFVFLSLQFVRETESASRQFSLSLFFFIFSNHLYFSARIDSDSIEILNWSNFSRNFLSILIEFIYIFVEIILRKRKKATDRNCSFNFSFF